MIKSCSVKNVQINGKEIETTEMADGDLNKINNSDSVFIPPVVLNISHPNLGYGNASGTIRLKDGTLLNLTVKINEVGSFNFNASAGAGGSSEGGDTAGNCPIHGRNENKECVFCSVAETIVEGNNKVLKNE